MSNLQWTDLDTRAIDMAKIIAADAVEKTGNGHPGTAISLAPAAYLLFQKFLKHNPQNPDWEGRDRFILSPGHSSLTLYIQLFLSGYSLDIEDIKKLRTWDSLTPGHPEYGHTPGVEITTGPLGQGLASAVGFAYSQRRTRNLLDPEAANGSSVFDHTIWVIASDGDLQEGVTAEACSLAGHQELGNIVVIYDDNSISIEGNTGIAFSENVLQRYESYGWHVQEVDWHEGHEYKEDLDKLAEALESAKSETTKPSIISLKTVIGWPSPGKQNTGKIHGSALGSEELAALKKKLNFDPSKNFVIEENILNHTKLLQEKGRNLQKKWDEKFIEWADLNPEKNKLFERMKRREIPEELAENLPIFPSGSAVSTRFASGKVINSIASILPEFWGGSADLAESNNTTIENSDSFVPYSKQTESWTGSHHGRVLHFGIREHAAAAIVNGITVHSYTRAFCGTFLVFSDYQRPAIRLAALMKISSIFVWTHDSIGLGEDGPTHQPVEHLSSLRAVPNFDVVRPADANETSWAWKTILERKDTPAGIVLSRQNLPVYDRLPLDNLVPSRDYETVSSVYYVGKGGYILQDSAQGKPAVIIMASGSEVSIALDARRILEADGVRTRVVSFPCMEWFVEQSAEYQEEVLPKNIKARVSVEAGIAQCWHKFIGDNGISISLEHYGASADQKTLYQKFGITAEAVVTAAHKTMSNDIK